METLYLVLVFLACVAISSLASRLPRVSVPLPFVQIAMGAVLSLCLRRPVTIDPEVFLVLFIAPLLYLDGWRIRREGLLRDSRTIGALALGLVVFTVAVAGYFIHWLLPTLPLAVAFALASVLSPTDAVAVSAITSRMPMPPRLMQILEGESLLNDASGLVCLRFAVAAVLTGAFSLPHAVAQFAWLAIGGVIIGGAAAWHINAVKDWLSRRFGEDPGSLIVISLLIPFAAYLAASSLSASGVLAAVAAGIAMNYEEASGRASVATRIRRAAVWDAMQFAGNGAIFVVLGYQLPGIVGGAAKVVPLTGHRHPVWLLAFVLAITLVLAALRFAWAWATVGLMRRGVEARRSTGLSAVRVAAAASLAGVRGAVTLSGVMALPFALTDGSPFPGRDLVIFLAAGVILSSLIIANVGLPWILRGAPPQGRAPLMRDVSATGGAPNIRL